MEMVEASARPRLAIGEWWADPATNELGRAGQTVRIEPKAMEVLMLLAERAGRVVKREELFSAIWPGVVVGDEALTQSIIKLRKALGDNPRAPAYIETISKRGYRLIAAVRQIEPAPSMRDGAEPAVQRSIAVVQHPRSVSAWLLAGAVVGLVAAAAYVFRAPPAPTIAAAGADEQQAASITLTVLPFESLASGDEQAYLARGISDDLMTELSRLPGLRLIRASSAASGDAGARDAGYLVSGSVQRVADTLRINIHLVDTRTSQQLWSERFVRPFGELFAVQDEMIQSVTAVLPGKIADAARERVARRHTRSLEAYDHFLRGQSLFLVRQPDENERARGFYRQALEADPLFARAYAGLAMTHAMDATLRPRDATPALARAFELAETARLIDPDLPEVHWALGFVHVRSRRHDQGILSLQKAIELNRSFADAYALMGGVHTYVGDPAKSIPLLRTALRLNPDGGYLYYMTLGRAYLFENDVEQALINLREASARNPVDLETRVYLAAAKIAAGDRSAAEWEVQEIRALDPGFSTQAWLPTYPLTSPRLKERLVELLANAGL